ncbi:hypothetical protein VB620_20305 [Nodularia harveyana UHCC-0300]|uniref:Uncharacterized protein n=1 Tax=Nodularia harveyana UHCC-0300 TaxID=2974287 RepID=A0ABU5UJD3_9CYAN|nr:hypothetical protein [Nodularia harveyana]MEA5583673.1 hypothetical protein [Nodularia harveyana UHCC-0300]
MLLQNGIIGRKKGLGSVGGVGSVGSVGGVGRKIVKDPIPNSQFPIPNSHL